MGAALWSVQLLVLMAVTVTHARAAGNGFLPWRESGFADAQHRWLHLREIHPRLQEELPFRLDLTVIYVRGTPWTQARAIRQIRRTAEILAACGVQLAGVRLARVRLQPELRRIDASQADPDSGVPPEVVTLSSLVPAKTPYPVAFMMGGVRGTKSLAISYRALDETGPAAAYLNTAWIGYRAHWLPRPDERYSALAHELAHLLCRCGHRTSPDSHLLHSARNFLSSRVLPEHCERIISSPLVSATH